MSTVTSPVMLDSTGQQILGVKESILEELQGIRASMHSIGVGVSILSGSHLEEISDVREIHAIVAGGHAKDYFAIGDQITVPWTDVATGTSYTMPFNVVHIPDEVELGDGEKVPGMYIQMAYALPFGVQFSAPQAMKYFENAGLPAGTYHVTFGAAYGDKAAQGDSFQFTLTRAVPVGGQLSATMRSDQDVSNWRVLTWESPSALTPLETVPLTAGSVGTSIGTLTNDTDSHELNTGRVGFGNNRYRDSAIRQFLNSAGGVGAWWTPQHNWDRFPTELATKAGLLSGFDPDFVNILGATKISVATNTICDGGVTDVMYDKFFLPSLEEMFFTPQAAEVEGEAWEYWERAAGIAGPLATGTAYPQMRTFALNAKTSPQHVRLRSASRAGTNSAWLVGASGSANVDGALGSYRPAAAACIC